MTKRRVSHEESRFETESIEDDRRRTWMMERVAGTWKEQSPETFEA